MNLTKVVFAFVAVLTAISAYAKDYGSGVGSERAVSVSHVLANAGSLVGKMVVVEGVIVDVCQARGCWMDLAGEKPGERLKIKVEDGVIVFPMEARGKKALVRGVLEALNLSKD